MRAAATQDRHEPALKKMAAPISRRPYVQSVRAQSARGTSGREANAGAGSSPQQIQPQLCGFTLVLSCRIEKESLADHCLDHVRLERLGDEEGWLGPVTCQESFRIGRD